MNIANTLFTAISEAQAEINWHTKTLAALSPLETKDQNLADIYSYILTARIARNEDDASLQKLLSELDDLSPSSLREKIKTYLEKTLKTTNAREFLAEKIAEHPNELEKTFNQFIVLLTEIQTNLETAFCKQGFSTSTSDIFKTLNLSTTKQLETKEQDKRKSTSSVRFAVTKEVLEISTPLLGQLRP
jgi:hypothetical protein